MAVDDETFAIEIHSKAGARLGWVGDPEIFTFTTRHGAQSTGALTLPTDHPKAPLLLADGARYVCRYEDEHLSSGMIRLHAKNDIGPKATYTWQLADDWRLLGRLIGLPVPGQTAANQGAAEHYVVSGPAESVVKQILTANLPRMAAVGLPVTVAPDLGRGAVITVRVRLRKLVEELMPVVDQAGIGITVRQVGAGLVVDCYEPDPWPINLSEEAGTIVGGSWSRELPTVTRVYVGAGGEGAERVIRGPYINTAAEAATGDWIEDFIDARDIKVDDPNRDDLMAARAVEHLAAGAWKAGLTIEFTETDNYRYGGPRGVTVGRQLTAELAPGVTVTDVLRAATLTTSTSDGVKVTPQLGERTDEPDAVLYHAVDALVKDARKRKVT